MATIDKFWEPLELAAVLVGMQESYDLDKTDSIGEVFFDKYNIDVDDLEKLVEDLLPLIQKDESPFSMESRKGFGYNGAYIVKVTYGKV